MNNTHLGEELDPRKVMAQQERELPPLERELFAITKKNLIELVNAVDSFRTQIVREVIDPLETEYGVSKDPAIFDFLYRLYFTLRNYNKQISRAYSQFSLGFESEFSRFRDYINSLRIPYVPKIQVYLSILEKIRKERGFEGNDTLGIAPVITTIIVSPLTDIFINEVLMRIPIFSQALKGIIDLIKHIWWEFYFITNPRDRERFHNITRRQKYLVNASAKAETGFNLIVEAISRIAGTDTKKGKVEFELEKLSKRMVQKGSASVMRTSPIEREVYVPYTIMPSAIKKEITVNTGRGAIRKVEREWKPLSGNDALEGFSPIQYATNIYIDRKDFYLNK